MLLFSECTRLRQFGSSVGTALSCSPPLEMHWGKFQSSCPICFYEIKLSCTPGCCFAAVCAWTSLRIVVLSVSAASTVSRLHCGSVTDGSRDFLRVWRVYFFKMEEQFLILAAEFFFSWILLHFLSSVASGSAIETPSTFPKLSVPCCAGNSKALLGEGVHVLVLIVASCMKD